MTILIEGMKMPETGWIEVRLFSDGWAHVDTSEPPYNKAYEVFSVPPHGRLGDLDALKAKQQEDADLFINACTLTEKVRRDEALNAVANIVNAPTIIPAEEGK